MMPPLPSTEERKSRAALPRKRVHLTVEECVSVPIYQTAGAAGADVRAYLKEERIILPGEVELIPTGMRAEIPPGYEMQVRMRSGLALQHRLAVLNSPGTIDSDYRGQIQVLIINHGKHPFVVTPGMRIAQLVLAPVARAQYCLRQELSPSGRGERGFGHSGTQ